MNLQIPCYFQKLRFKMGNGRKFTSALFPALLALSKNKNPIAINTQLLLLSITMQRSGFLESTQE